MSECDGVSQCREPHVADGITWYCVLNAGHEGTHKTHLDFYPASPSDTERLDFLLQHAMHPSLAVSMEGQTVMVQLGRRFIDNAIGRQRAFILRSGIVTRTVARSTGGRE